MRAWASSDRVRRTLVRALPILIVVYGAILRLDALTESYGPVATPAWLSALQQESKGVVHALHPARVTWDKVPLYPHRDGPPTRYFSDPYTYLTYAREMRDFSAAHHREPVFPFTTKLFLGWLHDQDVAVSFASAAFSVLAMLATYLLGAAAFSRPVGAVAALAVAVEYDLISWGVGGWRDDAFMTGIVLFAVALVRYLKAPSLARAGWIGAAAGGVCLVRLTSMSFVVPGLLYAGLVARATWRQRAQQLGAALLVSAVVVAPYLLNCWRVYGDPLYAVNSRTGDQLAMEAKTGDHLAGALESDSGRSPSALGYIGAKWRARPIEAIDTLATGLTLYPFLNKWGGFDRWIPALGSWLSWASLAGLILFAGSQAGRLLLVLLAASLIPFAATWKLASDWRFTEYAYPFFLIAAALALAHATAGIVQLKAGLRPALARISRGRVIFWTAVLLVVASGAWVMTAVLPPATLREALAAGDDVTIMAGERDIGFFRGGWSAPQKEGNVTFRLSSAPRPEIRVPLPQEGDYDVTVRADPFPRPPFEPLPALQVFLNGRFLSSQPMQWNPERVGAYDVHLPKAFVRPGGNMLVLMSSDPARTIGVWYVRVRPKPPVAPSS